MTPEKIRELDRLIIGRYSDRLRRLGRDPRTLGWDTVEHQRTRFAAALQLASFRGRDVIDVGCGFGDLLEVLEHAGQAPRSYRGIDLNGELLAVAQDAHPRASFAVQNVLLEPLAEASADVVTCFGVLNWRLPGADNLVYAKAMIASAWAATRGTLVVDMLSAQREASYPYEEHVFYYQPEVMLAFALTLTPHVALRHDYVSIPQREFMLALHRTPCDS